MKKGSHIEICWYVSRRGQLLSRVQFFVTPRTVACQAPLFMGISPGKNIGVGIATPSSRVSSQPRDWNLVSCMAGRFFSLS